MVATAPKRKKKKDQDFQKKKLKVGKKLQPSNQTKISIRSQAVFVPTQNLTTRSDEKQEPTNSNNATLKELMTLINHPNYNQRKDAAAGMQDLFQQHPYLLLERISIVVASSLKMMLDQYQPVRRAYLSLIINSFPKVSASALSPFFAQIMVYTCSAMTHIDENIRLDALKFLWFWFEHYPYLTVQHGARSILPNFIGLLSANSSGQQKQQYDGISKPGLSVRVNGKMSTTVTRMEVLESVYRFLQLCMMADDDKVDRVPAYSDSVVVEIEADIHHKLPANIPPLQSFQNDWRRTALPFQLFVGGGGLADKSSAAADSGDLSSASIDPDKCRQLLPHYDLAHNPADIQCYFNILYPVLIDIWLESYPIACGDPSQGAATAALKTCRLTLQIMTQLLLPLLQHRQHEQYQQQQQRLSQSFYKWLDCLVIDPIIKHVSPHFPFHESVGSLRVNLNNNDNNNNIAKVSLNDDRGIMVEMSVLYTQMMLSVMAFRPSALWTRSIVDFLISEVFDETIVEIGRNPIQQVLLMLSGGSSRPDFPVCKSSTSFDRLLAVLQTVVGQMVADQQHEILTALFNIANSAGTTSKALSEKWQRLYEQRRRAVGAFLRQLIARHLGHFRDMQLLGRSECDKGAALDKMALQFIRHVPRQLWEVAAKIAAATTSTTTISTTSNTRTNTSTSTTTTTTTIGHESDNTMSEEAEMWARFLHHIITCLLAPGHSINAAVMHSIASSQNSQVDGEGSVEALLEMLQLTMVPLFQFQTKQGRSKEGPFKRLPLRIQRIIRSTVDLMMPNIHPNLLSVAIN